MAASHSFLLARTDKSILSYPQITQVAEFFVGDISYSILRKTNTIQPTIIAVKGDTLSIKDLSRNSASWINELDTAVTVARNKHNSVYLISSIIPTEGIINFVQELLSQPKMSSVRLLFSLDKKISEINISDNLYREIFKKDLILSVLKDGVYGSYIPVPVKLKENISYNINLTNGTIKNKVVNCIGINLRDETLGVECAKNELGNVDYAGVTSTGQRVMGLARFDKDICKLIPDPILCWDIPQRWSFEDAATIPHAYVSVRSYFFTGY